MYISGTYFASWSIYQHKHFVTDLPVADITHVFYAFMKIDPNTGEVQLGDSWADAEIDVDWRLGYKRHICSSISDRATDEYVCEKCSHHGQLLPF